MSWFVINTHPKHEFNVSARCIDQGFKTFLPTYLFKTPKKGEVIRPLFPSYLFVEFDPETDRWSPLCSTIGVKKLISSYPIIDKKTKVYSYIIPTPVPDHLIEKLQQQILEPNIKIKTSSIQPGLRVKVISGPFEAHEGICSWSSDKRVALLMSVMNGQIQIEFSRESVELV